MSIVAQYVGKFRKEYEMRQFLRGVVAPCVAMLFSAMVFAAPTLDNQTKGNNMTTATSDSAFLTQVSSEEGVVTTDSGLRYKVLQSGTGVKPSATSIVTVNYEGRLVNGTVFDSSYQRGTPARFGVSDVIAGWTEALQLMSAGSTWELYIPSDLAYGARGVPGVIPSNAVLVFKVELIDVV